jgi:hypothetical protein
MPQTFDEVIADVFTVKNDTIPQTAWPKLSCGVANEVTFQDSSLKLGDQREVFFQNAGQLRAVADIRFLTGAPAATEKLRILPNGNVGIGTPTPGAKLEINNGDLLFKAATATPENAGAILFRSAGGGQKGRIWSNPSAGAGLFLSSGDNNPDITVDSNGNVGIGTITPGTKLTVQTATSDYGVTHTDGEVSLTTFVGTGNSTTTKGGWLGTSSNHDLRFFTANGPTRMTIDKTGNVGIGTIAPENSEQWNRVLDLVGVNHTKLSVRTNTIDARVVAHEWGWWGAPPGMVVGTKGNHPLSFATNSSSRMTILASGDTMIAGRVGTVGFSAMPLRQGWYGGVHTWDVEAEGTMWSRAGYYSGPFDLAENYYSDLDLAAGDVVCLDKHQDRIVQSGRANDDLVIGVISTQPGVLLNSNPDSQPPNPGWLPYPVALSGRVPCKVTDENGPIERGDLLTSSSVPGHAMKAKPIVVDGQPIYRPGTLIGKALESLASGKGMVEIFVCLR